MTAIAAVFPDVDSLLEQINISPDTWLAAIDLDFFLFFFFFLIPVSEDCQKWFLSAGKLVIYFQCSASGVCHSLALHPNLVYSELHHLSLPQGIVLIH